MEIAFTINGQKYQGDLILNKFDIIIVLRVPIYGTSFVCAYD